MEDQLKNTSPVLSRPKIIITGHANADFDCIASMVAVQKLYPGSVLIYPGSKERAVKSFFMQGASILFDFRSPKDVDFSEVELLVVVDTKQKNRVSHVDAVFKNPNLRIHLFDHHPATNDDLQAEYSRTEMWGATVSILVEELRKKNIELNRDEATLLGIGLYEDTGSLTFPATTEHDFIAAGWLRSQGMDLNTISEITRNTMTPDQVALLHTMLESGTLHEINGIPILFMDVSLESFLGDFSAVVQQAMQMTRAKVIFALATMGEKVQIVARSRVPEVDCGRICASFGGGGHAGAASASVKGKTISETKDALFGLLYSLVNIEITVRDIMSSPVHFVREDHTIMEAEEIMLRYILKAMPVVNPRNYTCTGLIEHQLAARALMHGLGDQPVAEYMSRSFFSINADDSLYSLMEMVIDKQQKLIPVIENKKLVGVVSRTDILEILLEDSARIPEPLVPEEQKSRNIQNLLNEQLPNEHMGWLRMAGQIADKLGMEAYAVGGFVRDILLSEPNFDLDLVVEGDGIAFAHAFAEQLEGRVKDHPEFRTAVIVFNDESGARQRIDVATARLEYYKHPAAMPTIELSSIKMDLYRRDFTINALAVHLNPAHFGLLVDFFGGQRDLKDRIIRVLHALSFIEDPTRILRGVRFERRFDFSLSNQAENLIKNALRLNVLDKLSGGRIFSELKLMFEEDSPLACFQKMEQLKLNAAIHPMLKMTPAKEESFASMEKVLSWYRLSYLTPAPELWICYFMCLTIPGKYLDVASLLERMAFSETERKKFLVWREETVNVLKNLQKTRKIGSNHSMGTLHEALARLPLESVLYIMSSLSDEEERRSLAHFITTVKNLKVDISGEDLIALGASPGPVFGEVLKEVLMAKLDGRAVSRTAQLDLARKLIEGMQASLPKQE